MKINELSSQIEIIQVKAYSDEIMKAIQSFLSQLTRSKVVFSKTEFEKIIHSENTVLIIARDTSAAGKIIGTLSYVFFYIPTGLNFRIEDVVVDQSARGKGVGRALMRYAISKAQEIKADKIDLTSSPERSAANKLYQSLGFILKKTNVYRYIP